MGASTASNPERSQDRARDLYCLWKRYGYVMFPQQRRIYEQIAANKTDGPVLEAGCGSGQGTAVLEQSTYDGDVIGTDKVKGNVDFARCLYPWVNFCEWDVLQPWGGHQVSVVVAVEVIEHVADPLVAIRNLIGAGKREVWISTPNGNGKPRPPENPYHCCEYRIDEIVGFFAGAGIEQSRIEVLGWEDFKPVPLNTDVNPLVYRIQLR